MKTIVQSNHERVGKGLELLSRGLKPFVERELRSRFGNAWEEPARKLSPFGKLNWADPKLLLDLIQDQWNALFANSLGRVERSFVIELLDWRNKWAHREETSSDDAYRALDSMARLLQVINAPEAYDLEGMRQEVQALQVGEYHRVELSEYLIEVAKWANDESYVERPDLQTVLCEKKNVILIGAPGSGKSRLLRECQARTARGILDGSQGSPIPCFLNLAGGEDIVSKIVSDTGQTEQVIQGILEAGEFWIAFDGVDEMVRFEETFSGIVDFINRYRRNKYAISIRREVFENRRFKDRFGQPLRKRKLEPLSVGEFGEDERHKLMRFKLGDEYYARHSVEISEFVNSLPDSNPLTLEMTAEILRDSPNPVFENPGRFYEQFFKARLKREADKKRSGHGTDTQLETILTILGGYAVENNTNIFLEDDVLNAIRDKTSSEPIGYYELLLNAEILDKNKMKVKRGRDEDKEEKVQFHHQTYRDYFVARALVLAGTLTDSEKRIEIVKKQGEENMILLLVALSDPKA